MGTNEDAFVEGWMERLSLRDKIGQTAQVDLSQLLNTNEDEDGRVTLNATKAQYFFGELGIGSVLNTAKDWRAADYRNAIQIIQDVARKSGRPPVIYGLDSVHGANYVWGSIMTPQPINLAATFSEVIAFEAGKMAAVATTQQAGIAWLFAPVLGLAWQPSWARVYETFGEDPLVVANLGLAIIQGIQSVPNASACAKHFLAYSNPSHGHDREPTHIPTRILYEYFLVPWRKVAKEVLTIMESYTDLNGVPNVANHDTLRRILRDELAFEGMLVTDYKEEENLFNFHHITRTYPEAVYRTLQEGSVDMSMVPLSMEPYLDAMMQAVDPTSNKRPIDMGRIDESVRRILRFKQQAGLLDPSYRAIPMSPEETEAMIQNRKQEREDALAMAMQGLVLVQNNYDVLPLKKERHNILVTGPTRDSLSCQSGGWTIDWQGGRPNQDFAYGSTVRQALEDVMEWTILEKCGTTIMGLDCGGDGDSIEEAAYVATQVDTVLVCIGEEAYAEKPGDLNSLDLVPGQVELVRRLREANARAKIIVVYFGGRTRLLGDISTMADAVLLAFLPGPDAGKAVMNVLTGSYNPSGRLPITYPKYQEVSGAPYLHPVSEICTQSDYKNQPLPHYGWAPSCEVQWPFGHGLSYTNYAYSGLQLSSTTISYLDSLDAHTFPKDAVDFVTVSITITNTGTMAGNEVVLFFSFDESRYVTPDYKRLRHFERIFLEPNESKVVTANITVEELRYIGPHDERHLVLQNGMRFRIGVGAGTDCRIDPNNELCTDVITLDAGIDYLGACDSACQIWNTSGCGPQPIQTKCWDACRAVASSASTSGGGHEGWGWNYVDCIESVTLGMQRRKQSKNECWKLTHLCRDIFATPLLDEYGAGPAFTDDSWLGVLVALIAGVLGIIIIALQFKTVQRTSSPNHTRDRIEFVAIHDVPDEEGGVSTYN